MIVSLAGIKAPIQLWYKETEKWFRGYKAYDRNFKTDQEWISVTQKSIEEYMDHSGAVPAYAEFNTLFAVTSDYLTHFDRFMFHGVAFRYGNDAFILTAPSGTGKSTQYRNLRTLFGSRYQIICGDKPILCRAGGGRIMVCPSPWNGKEGWGSLQKGLLKGIILLEQGEENVLKEERPENVVVRIMEQVINSAPDLETVHKTCRFTEDLLEKIPVYSFVNKGNFASSEMLDTLIRGVESKQDGF